MNTKVVVGVIVVIIIAGGAYYFLGKGASGTSGAPTSQTQGGGATSLASLVAAGQPVTCTFSTTTAAGTEQGTMYISNGMVAGDFTMSGGTQGTINAHMIVRDSTNYVWTSLSSQGFKSTVTANNSPSSKSQGVDYNAQSNYSCQPWSADSSKFNLPTNISFISSASYTPPSQGAGATGAGAGASAGVSGSSAQCGQCNSLPSAQKAQCLAALNCQ